MAIKIFNGLRSVAGLSIAQTGRSPCLCDRQIRMFNTSRHYLKEHDDSVKGKVFKFKAMTSAINHVPNEDLSGNFGADYLKSSLYKNTYGDKFVWEDYRRNFKGAIPKLKTRKQCLVKNYIRSANPCPVCRDPDLKIDYRNPELLKQFIHPYKKEVLHTFHTKVCQQVQTKIVTEVEKAKLKGTLTFDLEDVLVVNS